MRAKEFIRDRPVQEIAPFLAALGGALARGAVTAGGALARGTAAAGGALARGAATAGGALARGAASMAKGAVDNITPTVSTGSSGTTTSSQPTNKVQPPVTVPGNTKIEPVVSKDPNKLKMKIGDLEFDLDLKDPKVQQQLQQLGKAKTL